jgi:hypothetical protein
MSRKEKDQRRPRQKINRDDRGSEGRRGSNLLGSIQGLIPGGDPVENVERLMARKQAGIASFIRDGWETEPPGHTRRSEAPDTPERIMIYERR